MRFKCSLAHICFESLNSCFPKVKNLGITPRFLAFFLSYSFVVCAVLGPVGAAQPGSSWSWLTHTPDPLRTPAILLAALCHWVPVYGLPFWRGAAAARAPPSQICESFQAPGCAPAWLALFCLFVFLGCFM